MRDAIGIRGTVATGTVVRRRHIFVRGIAEPLREELEHIDGRPFGRTCQFGNIANQLRRHGGDARQKDTVHRARGFNVRVGAMRADGCVERMDQIDQTVRTQARQGNARKVQRVDPHVVSQRRAAGVLRDEGAIERAVVRNEV